MDFVNATVVKVLDYTDHDFRIAKCQTTNIERRLCENDSFVDRGWHNITKITEG